MIYRLVDILEDIDFGCEERKGDRPLMAVAVLEDPDKNQIRFKMADNLFTQRGLQAGDSVYIDEDDTLRKAITSPDWTKEFGSKDIDVAGFVRDGRSCKRPEKEMDLSVLRRAYCCSWERRR